MLRPELREAYQWGTKVTHWLTDALRERDAALRERDRARDIAVALEGQVASLEQRIEDACLGCGMLDAVLDPDPADRGAGRDGGVEALAAVIRLPLCDALEPFADGEAFDEQECVDDVLLPAIRAALGERP